MKNDNIISIDDINEVIENHGAGVWQITDSHELIFTTVASDKGMTCSEVYDDCDDAISNKPEITDSLIAVLDECNR